MPALALLALVLAPLTSAQLSDLPNLSTVTQTTASSATAATSSSAASTTSAGTSSDASATTSFVATGSSSSSGVVHLSSLPTIAGAGIPTLVVPDTAGAPFMQKSDLPEGTVFIAVGAVLAFFGACVLLWRAMVAWSINRSVKRAARASMRPGSEKPASAWTGSASGYNPVKSGPYKDLGSSMSMEALTSTGKPAKSHFKDHDTGRNSPPPSNLFFSPTAHARSDAARPLSDLHASRNSAYLPAGYYASPSAQAAGGARATTLGGPTAPYARSSFVEPSPPESPTLQPTRGGAAFHNPAARLSNYGQQPSSSSLMVGAGARGSNDGLAGSRAPSAYLDEMFENHTAMASRDRL